MSRVSDRLYAVSIPRNLSFYRAVVQLVTSTRLPDALIVIQSEGSSLVFSATEPSLEGRVLAKGTGTAFLPSMLNGRRTMVLSSGEIPFEIRKLMPATTATAVVGPVISSAGAPLGFVASYGVRSVTESDRSRVAHAIEIVERHLDDKKEQSTQRATGASLKVASTKLQRYSEKLKSENENLDLFAEFTAHEVKNPLRAIMLCSDYLQLKLTSGSDDLSSDEAAGMLGQISEEAQVLYDQIENILTLGKPETEIRRSQPVDLAEVTRQCFQRYAAELVAIDATIDVGPMGTAHGDPAQILMVMSNLVSNAIRYRSEERALEIRIESADDDEFVKISVSDNGIGIRREDQQRIFEAYTRCGPDLPGLGLGLALSHRSLEQVGGSIEVESELDEGTTFTVVLHRAAPQQENGRMTQSVTHLVAQEH